MSPTSPHPTERLRLQIAYDGKPFRGWQSQLTRDGIQDFVEEAFRRVLHLDHRVPVIGSGRTDAGVHALGQVAHVDVPAGRIQRERWILAINANLPPEIRVLRVAPARKNFHAQFDARGKVYTYRIWNSPSMHPLEINRAWHVPGALNLEKIRACLRLFEGHHDFASFAANRGTGPVDSRRTIRSIDLQARGQGITLRFEGDGFLYKMVRLLTGSAIRCGQERAEIDWIKQLLDYPGTKKSHFVAPAEGLYLTRVTYGKGRAPQSTVLEE